MVSAIRRGISMKMPLPFGLTSRRAIQSATRNYVTPSSASRAVPSVALNETGDDGPLANDQLVERILGKEASHRGATRPIYMDAQSTTPVDPRVLDSMLPYYVEQYGTPHSRTHA